MQSKVVTNRLNNKLSSLPTLKVLSNRHEFQLSEQDKQIRYNYYGTNASAATNE